MIYLVSIDSIHTVRQVKTPTRRLVASRRQCEFGFGNTKNRWAVTMHLKFCLSGIYWLLTGSILELTWSWQY